MLVYMKFYYLQTNVMMPIAQEVKCRRMCRFYNPKENKNEYN